MKIKDLGKISSFRDFSTRFLKNKTVIDEVRRLEKKKADIRDEIKVLSKEGKKNKEEIGEKAQSLFNINYWDGALGNFFPFFSRKLIIFTSDRSKTFSKESFNLINNISSWNLSGILF